ncbi:unnamed protein product [Parnassius apollo]|uniref:(apollo) hypothetical protein n=1 Tax=Parnassius apollo TaxID=110799 RepID=A0A8S3XLZ1_PARAO|nr:unnamed protein product [Parnassius apollo]
MNLEISENEFKKLVDLSNVFDILKATVKELCKRNANLMTSDAVLMFMLKKLEALHHEPVARELLQSLKRKIKERRLLVTSTLNYLHNPKSYIDSSDDDYYDIFLRPNGDEMRKHIADLHQLGQTQATERTIDVAVSTTDEENKYRNDESDTLPLKKQL